MCHRKQRNDFGQSICRAFRRGQGGGGPCTVAVGSITNRCRSPAPSVRRRAGDSRVFDLGTSQVEHANSWPNISCLTVAQCVAVRARISMRVQLLYSLPLTTNPAIQGWRI